ncbi:YhbY family RNA-binding protein [Metallosphaera hakonensis]|uniref:RNA-binding protein n=2 Tax=Metallosphaera hakonensis TaxID=79601 RepID=A0A2U9IS88_9CREN|nr:YhbY family RNA-binding protein [Metallosphaera hakonensis]AWR98910.1 RNA-binding protein [Metallosphaera hakonensis JCM 8857 = DSM 7519]
MTQGTQRDLKEVRSEGADIRIGKMGLTEGVKDEIRRCLKDHGIVKVKLLDKSLDRWKTAEITARETESELVEVRGRTFILRRNDSH